MRYELDTEVLHRKTGNLARIHDYSHRYKDYTLIAGGKTYYNVKEDDIEDATLELENDTASKKHNDT